MSNLYRTLDPTDLSPAVYPHPDRDPISISTSSQLFVDDHLVAEARSVHRRLNQPHKTRTPFLVPDRPWEGNSILYSCIIKDGAEYRLYYKAKNWSPLSDSPYRSTTINLATGTDGESFEKKPLADAAVPDTNIVLNDSIDDFTVARDPDDPDPDQRYKLLASRGDWRKGLTPATSSDGISWTWGREHAVQDFGDRCAYWYDPIRKKHIAWSRNQPAYRKRVIFHTESDDLDAWTPARLAIMPEAPDPPDTQIYGGYGFWYRSLYLAYIEVYEVAHQRLHTQLASSRDGLTWSRVCNHDMFLPNGNHGEFDAYWIVPTFNPPILKDKKLLIHYGGRPDPHKAAGFDHVAPGMGGSLALSSLREDGFVSLDATGEEGIVETHPVELGRDRKTLSLNVSPFHTDPSRDPMEAGVELLDQKGKSLSAYILDDDQTDRVWFDIQPDHKMPDIVRLRFRLRNARLYSFRIH